MPARESASTRADPGEMIAGKYRIERVLGAGGMGIVYAARHVDLHEVFAIKLMRPAEEGEGDAAATERFLREARASARLRGEHVARVHDVGRLEDGTPYMVMEHLDGVDLRKLFKSRRGALPIDEVVDHVLQACEAVAEAHAAGIIHRDLKPANLFLTRRPNGTPCIKVLDFGISKQLGAAKGLDVTNTTDILGSPFYMAPEQMRSGRSADPRSDIWSLGVVLYELAGGVLPFQGDSITEVCARVLQDRPIPLATRSPGVSAGFDHIVLRCLEKEPENRFQTVAELAAALRALRAGDPVAIAATTARASLPAAQEIPAEAAPSAAWGTTGTKAEAPRGSWSRLHIGLVAVLCIAAGAVGAAALFLARGDSGPPATPVAAAGAPSVTAAATSTESSSPSVSPAASAVPPASAASSEAPPPASAASSTVPGPPRPSVVAPPRPRVVDYGDRQ
jgi:tRNA A-37 threonylcarbamoyl transferase component Bud32